MSLQQLRKGSTDLLVLSVLTNGTQYGYQIMRELEERSDGYFTMTAALLYPVLHKLERDELVTSEWQDGQGKRRRKYYTLTTKGKQALADNQAEWKTFIRKLYQTLDQPLPRLGGEGSSA